MGSYILLSLGEMVSEVDFYLNATPDAQKQQNVSCQKKMTSQKQNSSLGPSISSVLSNIGPFLDGKWFQIGSYILLSLGDMVPEVNFYLDAQSHLASCQK